jgi:hypothetical protein
MRSLPCRCASQKNLLSVSSSVPAAICLQVGQDQALGDSINGHRSCVETKHVVRLQMFKTDAS